MELIVELPEAQDIINMVSDVLKEQVPPKIYGVASKFLAKWKALPMFKMVKQ
jgi:hypothetical protein